MVHPMDKQTDRKNKYRRKTERQEKHMNTNTERGRHKIERGRHKIERGRHKIETDMYRWIDRQKQMKGGIGLSFADKGRFFLKLWC
jgi:hypothetical protein